jgi:hypothetical protein
MIDVVVVATLQDHRGGGREGALDQPGPVVVRGLGQRLLLLLVVQAEESEASFVKLFRTACERYATWRHMKCPWHMFR